LNRPDKLNAFSLTMAKELVEVFDLVDVDDRVKVVVMTGAGRAFCAGQDLDIGFPKSSGKSGRKNAMDGETEREHRDS
jgi:enoyl-CoA hydratase/carnithine racemase